MSSTTPTGTEEEPDLDYGDLGVDPDADTVLLEVPRYERTEAAPTKGSWDLRAFLRADRARRAEKFEAGGDIELIDGGKPIPHSELPTGARKVVDRVVAAGWEVAQQCSIVYVTPTLFVESKEGEHNRGDVRFPDHDDFCFAVQARLELDDQRVAEFWAVWVRKESPGKKPSTTFKGATYWDVATKQVLWTKVLAEFDDWLSILAPA